MPPHPPRRFVCSGEVLRSESGRILSAIPKLPLRTNRGALLAFARLDAWLAREANAEAAALPLKFLPQYFNPKNMSTSDRDCANLILFGDSDGPDDRHRVAIAARVRA